MGADTVRADDLPETAGERTKRGDIVLDPFGGSGTTMIAAEQLKRRCYMMEINPHYADIILAWWEAYTGGKAEKND